MQFIINRMQFSRAIMTYLLTLSFLVFLSGCSKEPKSTLTEVFITDPLGWDYSNYVEAKVHARIDFEEGQNWIGIPTGDAEPITISIEWWWEDGNGSNDSRVSTDHTTITSTYFLDHHTTRHYADPGYVLCNYYWIKISWTDDEGSHNMTSRKAYMDCWGFRDTPDKSLNIRQIQE